VSEDGRFIVIDARTGQEVERTDFLPREYEDQVKGLQRDVRAWSMRYAELKRDKDQSAKHHPLYNDAELAFRHWKAACNHERSPFTSDRFWLVLPYLENPKYGLKMVMRAIEGAEHEAFEVTRRNGSTKRFDEWERIFKNAGSFEEFCNRAPTNKKGGPK
jgi:hypothetical protein